MAISYIGGRTQGFAGTTSTVSVSLTGLTGGFDTAPSAGDFVVVFYGVGSGFPTRNITIGSGQGWTSLTKIDADDTQDINYVVAYKRMGSTPDTSVTVSGTGSTADAGAVVVHVFRGVDETTPLDVAAVPATGIDTPLANPAAITPVTSGAIIIVSAATAYSSVAVQAFSSPELFNFRSGGSNDTFDVTVGAGWTDWTSGAFDPAPFSWSGSVSGNNSWATYTLSLRPAPEPDPPTPTGEISFVGQTFASIGTTIAQRTFSLSGLSLGSDPAPSAGDLVVVYHSASTTADRAITIDTPGYTTLPRLYSDATVDTNLIAAYKVMGSTPDRSITVSATSDNTEPAIMMVQVFRGVDGSVPLDVAATSSTGIDNALSNPAPITPVTAGAWVSIGGVGSRQSFFGSFTISAGFTSTSSTTANNGIDRVHQGNAGYLVWSSGEVDPAQFTSNSSPNAGESWAAYTLALRPAPSGVAVDPDDITTGSPTLGNPVVSVFVETPTDPDDIATAAPVLGSPTVAQVHSLTPAAIVTGAALLGAAALSQWHVLAGQGIVTGAPEAGQAALAQAHAFAPNDLVTGAPVLGSPAIAVEGVVSPANLETGSPVLGPLTLAQGHVLAFDGLETGSPDVELADLLQAHGLTIGGLVAGSPVLGAADLAQDHAFSVGGLETGSPVLGAPGLATEGVFAPSDLITLPPVLGSPDLTQAHVLTLGGIVTGSPDLGLVDLFQSHALAVDNIVTNSPVIGLADLVQGHVLGIGDLMAGSPILGMPAIGAVGRRVARISGGSQNLAPSAGENAVTLTTGPNAAAISQGPNRAITLDNGNAAVIARTQNKVT